MVRLSLLSKAKNEPLATQPVVIGKPSKNPVTRAAKKPRLRPGSGPDNDPNPVYAQNSDPDDLDFVPVSTRTDDTSKQGYHTTPDLQNFLICLAPFSK